MITHIDITGVKNYAPDEKTKRYVQKKIGSLDRLTPRHARKSLYAEVKIAELHNKGNNKYEVEVLLHVPEKTLTAKDATMNALAATDIVEQKLAVQLRKYKQEHVPHIGRRKLLDRFKRGFAREQQA
ncbi:MAG TPA: HPF/RaiA family ribosome-associated protein [Patescibacteria group bacterium]|jgi:putative sigma-54 modulation protein|nr:HPF/RaiA family ribosome-associated protein [Patescibacteria group bacterium]